MPQKVTIIAPVAILPLKSYTQEATNTEWSDIRVIRTTKRLPVHAGFVQSCRNSTLRTGNCSWGLQGMLLSASYSPRHSRTQELHWQDCRLDSVLLVLFNEFTQIEEQFVWENWLFGLPTLESGQAREVSPLHLQAVMRKLNGIILDCASQWKMTSFEAKYLPSMVHGRAYCNAEGWRNMGFFPSHP